MHTEREASIIYGHENELSVLYEYCVCVLYVRTYTSVSGDLYFNLRVFVGYPAQEC